MLPRGRNPAGPWKHPSLLECQTDPKPQESSLEVSVSKLFLGHHDDLESQREDHLFKCERQT